MKEQQLFKVKRGDDRSRCSCNAMNIIMYISGRECTKDDQNIYNYIVETLVNIKMNKVQQQQMKD